MELTNTLILSRPATAERKEPGRVPGVLYTLRTSTFWVKLTHWEYWDFHIVYASVFFLHLWQSLKARSFFYFSAANPGLENAGFIGERKSEIMKKIPARLQPSWFLVDGQSLDFLRKKLDSHRISFPLICKPDVGERGKGVSRIDTPEALADYHARIGVPYLIQSFVDLPLEFGVFYYRLPGEASGVVSSIVQKDFLTLKGNGKQTLAELVEENPRARFVSAYLSKKFHARWNEVLPKGTVLELEGIGNHCRGTTFLNANSLITTHLTDAFDRISLEVDGFYFGRYDLRAASKEALELGDVQILELNGAGAEPAHIYQPGFSFWEGQKVLWQHWRMLFRISQKNRKSGTPIWNRAQANAIRKEHQNRLQSIGN